MKKTYLLFLIMLIFLFSSFDVFAEGEKVYIIYRDTNGKMAKTIYDPALLWKGTGHVGFLIVYPDGSSYVVDTIQSTGVRETDLKGFNDGQAQNLWFFDTGLTQEQSTELIGWLKQQLNTPYTSGKWHQGEQKGPNEYDCVGLVEVG
ncbi:MAG: hypothetical protein QMD92_07255 [bacterium]|nr:hypothetical protein [bacterium]